MLLEIRPQFSISTRRVNKTTTQSTTTTTTLSTTTTTTLSTTTTKLSTTTTTTERTFYPVRSTESVSYIISDYCTDKRDFTLEKQRLHNIV